MTKENDNINYAELYGVYPNESDFTGAIIRSLKNGIQHLSKDFIEHVNNVKEQHKKH